MLTTYVNINYIYMFASLWLLSMFFSFSLIFSLPPSLSLSHSLTDGVDIATVWQSERPLSFSFPLPPPYLPLSLPRVERAFVSIFFKRSVPKWSPDRNVLRAKLTKKRARLLRIHFNVGNKTTIKVFFSKIVSKASFSRFCFEKCVTKNRNSEKFQQNSEMKTKS